MNFTPGDTVCLRCDDRKMIVVAKLDTRLHWVRLAGAEGPLYAFRAEDLRLIAAAEPQPARPVVTSVPQVPRADAADCIAA